MNYDVKMVPATSAGIAAAYDLWIVAAVIIAGVVTAALISNRLRRIR